MKGVITKSPSSPVLQFVLKQKRLRGQPQAITIYHRAADLWLHVITSDNALTSGETEKPLAVRADAFRKALPLASPVVHGLIIAVNEPPHRSLRYNARWGATIMIFKPLH